MYRFHLLAVSGEIAARHAILPLPVPAPLGPVLTEPKSHLFNNVTKVSSELWAAGEGQAKRILSAFIQQKVQDYKQDRDSPHRWYQFNFTYLAIGVVSQDNALRCCMTSPR